jgi:hypothetical protein
MLISSQGMNRSPPGKGTSFLFSSLPVLSLPTPRPCRAAVTRPLHRALPPQLANPKSSIERALLPKPSNASSPRWFSGGMKAASRCYTRRVAARANRLARLFLRRSLPTPYCCLHFLHSTIQSHSTTGHNELILRMQRTEREPWGRWSALGSRSCK